MMSYMGISLALAILAKLWLRPRRVNCGRCFLRDEACKEFGGVVRTYKSSVLICKDVAAVPIGIFRKVFRNLPLLCKLRNFFNQKITKVKNKPK